MATKTVKQMCCVRIGYMDFLLPVDAGLRIVALMQDAVPVDAGWAGDRTYRITAETIEVGMTIVKPSQVLPR